MKINKIEPYGSKMLIKGLPKENFTTESGLEVVENELAIGEVIEVSQEYADIFKRGDHVLYPKGEGMAEYYKGFNCVWIDCRPVDKGGHIWCKIKD